MFAGLLKAFRDFLNNTFGPLFSVIEAGKKENMASGKPRHILRLTRDEKRKFIESFDLVLSDCDGVLWTLTEIFEDIGTAIKLLKDAGKDINYVSNNSIRSEENYIERFREAGIETDINHLIHPYKSIIQYLRATQFGGLIYCIGTQVFKDLLKKSGYDVIDGPNAFIEEDFRILLKNVFDKQPVKAVIMDVDFNLSVVKLMKADQFLKQHDCILIAGATDMVLPVGKYGTIIGPGPYLKILEDTSKKQAKVLGKPGKELSEIIIDTFKVKDPQRVLFIGDMLEQDIQFGKMSNFQTLLVLTGGTSENDLVMNDKPEFMPNYYANSLTDFIEFFATLDCGNSSL